MTRFRAHRLAVNGRVSKGILRHDETRVSRLNLSVHFRPFCFAHDVKTLGSTATNGPTMVVGVVARKITGSTRQIFIVVGHDTFICVFSIETHVQNAVSFGTGYSKMPEGLMYKDTNKE